MLHALFMLNAYSTNVLNIFLLFIVYLHESLNDALPILSQLRCNLQHYTVRLSHFFEKFQDVRTFDEK